MGKFSGAFMRAQGPFYRESDALVHTADPDHADLSEPDSNAWSYQAPESPLAGYMPDNEWMGVQVPNPDQTPYGDHSVGASDRPRPNAPFITRTGLGSGNLRTQMEAGVEAGRDYGDPENRAYVPASFQFANEVYGADRFDSFGPQPVADQALRRGPNSDPSNNPPIDGQPEGFRLGSDLVPYVDRKMYVGERFHDRKWLAPNDAEVPTDQVRPQGTSAYLSPFDSATRMITRVFNTPERAQTPPDFSESITVDPNVRPPDTFPENW